MARCIDPALPPTKWAEVDLFPASRVQKIDVKSCAGDVQQQSAFLVSEKYAYQRIQNQQDIPLGFGGNRGRAVFCVAFKRITSSQGGEEGNHHIYQEPGTEEEVVRVVVKEVNKRQYISDRSIEVDVKETNENPYNEIAALRYLAQHSWCVMCFEALETDRHVYIVTPFMQGGELSHYIPWVQCDQRRDIAMGMPPAQVKVLFKQIVLAVRELHSVGVCHRDLKNENIVLRDQDINNARPVIIDFGMSLRVPSSPQGNHKIRTNGDPCGTPRYVAPEVYGETTSIDGFQVDVWCLGISLFCLLTARYLYAKPHDDDMQFKHFITNKGLTNDDINNIWGYLARKTFRQVDVPEHVRLDSGKVGEVLRMIVVVQQLDDLARDLLQKMLLVDPNQRITVDEVLAHPWLDTETVAPQYVFKGPAMDE